MVIRQRVGVRVWVCNVLGRERWIIADLAGSQLLMCSPEVTGLQNAWGMIISPPTHHVPQTMLVVHVSVVA